jgi:hypothetical protein
MREVDNLLFEVQRIGIEIQEKKEAIDRHLNTIAELRDATNYNADLYRRDMRYVLDVIEDYVGTRNGVPIRELYGEVEQVYTTGREELKSARDGVIQ